MSNSNEVDADATTETGLKVDAKHLTCKRSITIPPTKSFIVGTIFNDRKDNPFGISIEGDILKLIFSMMSNEILSYGYESQIVEYGLLIDANDSQLVNDFDQNPAMPIRQCLTLLKTILENHGKSNENVLKTERNCPNIFHVDISGLYVNSTIVLKVYPYADKTGFLLVADSFDSESHDHFVSFFK